MSWRNARLGRALASVAVGFLVVGAAPAPAAIAGRTLDWAFPSPPPAAPPAKFSTVRDQRLPGARSAFSKAELHDLFHAVDWRPESHPPMPAPVRAGRPPDLMACGFCHLPDGRGRPENATLAGLPAAYIRQQVDDMRKGLRVGARPAWRPTALMHQVAMAASPAEVAAAAEYFSRIRFVSRLKVVEAATIPHAVSRGGLYEFTPGREPVGRRIVEGPDDFARFEMRDETVGYVAYVPPGTVARGAKLVQTGADGRVQPCASCHGAGLRGALGPPLAGRSPTGMVRQLAAFAQGARKGAAAGQMRQVAARLDADEMMAAAAYAASLKP